MGLQKIAQPKRENQQSLVKSKFLPNIKSTSKS